MSDQELLDRIRGVLATIAPETAGAAIEPATPLRDAAELDSMDFLNFVIALHRELGVEVPERDYAKLVTLGDFAAYVAARLPQPAPAADAGPPRA